MKVIEIDKIGLLLSEGRGFMRARLMPPLRFSGCDFKPVLCIQTTGTVPSRTSICLEIWWSMQPVYPFQRANIFFMSWWILGSFLTFFFSVGCLTMFYINDPLSAAIVVWLLFTPRGLTGPDRLGSNFLMYLGPPQLIIMFDNVCNVFFSGVQSLLCYPWHAPLGFELVLFLGVGVNINNPFIFNDQK